MKPECPSYFGNSLKSRSYKDLIVTPEYLSLFYLFIGCTAWHVES